MKTLSAFKPLSHIVMLLEARDDYLVQTFGDKLVGRVTAESNNGMQMPEDLVTKLRDTNDTTPPANKIVAWFVEKDPLQGKGVQWMIVQYTREQYHLEDIERVRGLMTEFVRVRTQLQAKDLGQYRTLEALDVALDEFRDKKIETKSQTRERIELPSQFNDQITILLDTDQYLVFSENTHSVAKYVASNDFVPQLNGYRAATWCTGHASSGHYDNYKSQGPIYFILIKSGPDAGKYQFHFPTSQFNIASNTRIPAFGSWLRRNDPIRQVFKSMAADAGILDFLDVEELESLRAKYVDDGRIKVLYDSDGIEISYLSHAYSTLHPFLMRGHGQARSKLVNTSNSVVYSNPYAQGVLYIRLPDEKIFTYKLGATTAFFNDTSEYPMANIGKRYPPVVQLINQLIRQHDDYTTPSITANVDEKIQTLVDSGKAKVVTDTKELSVWWFADSETFYNYFNVRNAQIKAQLHGTTASFDEKSGVLLMDVGSAIASYQLGDVKVCILVMDEIAKNDGVYYTARNTRHDVVVSKFIAENPSLVPIMRKFADYYKYYPLMSDKPKNQLIQELEQANQIKVIHKNGPSVVQLLTPDCYKLILPSMGACRITEKIGEISPQYVALDKELQRGPIYLIQGNILFSPLLGHTFQLNSNNGEVLVSTQMIFQRFPILATIFKDVMLANGIPLPDEPPNLSEMIPAMVTAGTIIPVNANPLVIQLNNLAGVRWFVDNHRPTPLVPKKIEWDVHRGIRNLAFDQILCKDPIISNKDDVHMANEHIASFGFLDKAKKPQIVTIAHRPGVRKTAAVALLYHHFENDVSKMKNITSTQGTFAYLQKFPVVAEKIISALEGLDNPSVQEMLEINGYLKKSEQDSDESTAAASETANSINELLRIARVRGNTLAAQPLTTLLDEKFIKGCYKITGYMQRYANQFTFDQAKTIAKRILNMMNFLSADSLRNMPEKLAEWLKYAPQLNPSQKLEIASICPAFIAGIENPSPGDIRRILELNATDSTLEVVRHYAKMDPADERELDRYWYLQLSKPIGVNYNNVEDLVLRDLENAEQRGGNSRWKTVMGEKVMYLRNLPPSIIARHINMSNKQETISLYPFIPEDFAVSIIKQFPDYAKLKHRGQPGVIPISRRTPKVKAAMAYARQHGTLTGFIYTPTRLGVPNISPAQTPTARTARQPAVNNAPPRERAAPPPGGAGFATKAAHARHIIDNRTPEDTRQSLIRRLIDEVGLTTAGASTYYYNLTRPGVREGDESLDLFKLTLRSLWG